MAKTVISILAGGQGTRFWPVSRADNPKQFLSISETGESLIQTTARRVEKLGEDTSVLVLTGQRHAKLVEEHLPNATVVAEPVARNTAPAIGLGAIHARKLDPEAVMVVLPADSAVSDEAALLEALSEAVEVASKRNLLVTIGIAPTFAHTGYGYIKRGEGLEGNAFILESFQEKPDRETADKYLASGEYFWNSGTFVWKASAILDAIKSYMPELYAGLEKIDAAIGSPDEQKVVEEVFESTESISIDYGVMERSEAAAVLVPKPFGWSDVGSWDAWGEYFPADEDKNVLVGEALALDSKNCIVYGKERLVAVVGAEDMVVIDSGDALLVCPRDRVQEVKEVVNELKKQGKTELL